MNQPDQSELTQMIDRYMALWNEPDTERRRQLIAELWIEDGRQFTTQHEHRGYTDLEKRVTHAHEEFVKKGGFVFKLSNTPREHHQAIAFTWEMVPVGGGTAGAAGSIFLLLSDDGRIHTDYQF